MDTFSHICGPVSITKNQETVTGFWIRPRSALFSGGGSHPPGTSYSEGVFLPTGEIWMPKEDTQFKPGQSGNPLGRPKGVARQARDLVGNDPARLLQVLLDIAEDKGASRGERRAAAAEYLDRGWGKAASYSPVEDGDPLELGDVERTIADLVDELAARRETKTSGPAENGKVAAPGSPGATPA